MGIRAKNSLWNGKLSEKNMAIASVRKWQLHSVDEWEIAEGNF